MMTDETSVSHDLIQSGPQFTGGTSYNGNGHNPHHSIPHGFTSDGTQRLPELDRDKLNHALPDYLEPDLDMVFIGINPGFVAAETGKYYAGSGNHFWSLLFMSGLLKEQLNSEHDFELPKYGIGLTNIVERTTRGSHDLSQEEIKAGSEVLLRKLQTIKPKIAVFNGKEIYRIFSGKKEFSFGKQPEPLSGTDILVYVMPSSSARCAQLPKALDKLPYFEGLRKLRDFTRGELLELDESEVTFCGTLKSPAKRACLGADVPFESPPNSAPDMSPIGVKQESCHESSEPPQTGVKRSLQNSFDTSQQQASFTHTSSVSDSKIEFPVKNELDFGNSTDIAPGQTLDQSNSNQQQMMGSMFDPNQLMFNTSQSETSISTPEPVKSEIYSGDLNPSEALQFNPQEAQHNQRQVQYNTGLEAQPRPSYPGQTGQNYTMQAHTQSPGGQSHRQPTLATPSPSMLAPTDPEIIGMHIAESVAAVVARCKDGSLEFPEHYIRPSDPPPVKHSPAPPMQPSRPHHQQQQQQQQQSSAVNATAANQLLAGLAGQRFMGNQGGNSSSQAAQALENYLTPYLQNQQQEMYQQAMQQAAGNQGGNGGGGDGAQWPAGFYDYLQGAQQQQNQFLQQSQDLYAPYFTGNMMYGQQPGNQQGGSGNGSGQSNF